MPFPPGWPPRPPSGMRSIRFFEKGTTTNDFADNAFIFSQQTGASTLVPTPIIRPGDTAAVVVGDFATPGSPMGGGTTFNDLVAPPQPEVLPMVWADTIRVTNDDPPGGSTIQISFDGANIHGEIAGGSEAVYRGRKEAGISIRHDPADAATDYRIEAW